MDETTIETSDFINALSARIGELEKENIVLNLLARKQEALILSLRAALLSVAEGNGDADGD